MAKYGEFDFVIVRERMLNEEYGAHLWKTHTGCEVITTPQITEMTENYLQQIKGKSVLIVGGYYRDNMGPIVKACQHVVVFFNTSDDSENSETFEWKLAREGEGFLLWTTRELSIQDELVLQMAEYLDQYLYGYPSEDSLCFQNGVYVIDKKTDIEKILTIKTIEDIKKTIEQGKVKRINNLRIAEQRYSAAERITFMVDREQHEAIVGIGDTPIVDTCLLLAKKSKDGLGILFRYSLYQNKTFVSMRTTKESGIDAGKLMKKLMNGGGSKPMGGGSVNGLFFPRDFFKRQEKPNLN